MDILAVSLTITRWATLILLVMLLVRQALNKWVRRKQLNGLKSTRNAILWLTAGYFLQVSLITIADLHSIFLNRNKYIIISQLEPFLLASRVIMLIAVWKSYSLLHEHKK